MEEEVWNDHALDKDCETIEYKIAEGMDIWNDPNQDVSALCYDVKLYTVIIKHHTQSTKSGVQDIALCSAGGRSKGDSSEISTICSMHLPPLHARLETSYREKKKRSGNQNQGPGIDGERLVKTGIAEIRHMQK